MAANRIEQDKFVIVHIWLPHNEAGTVPITEAAWRSGVKKDGDVMVGHVTLSFHEDGHTEYMSIWPDIDPGTNAVPAKLADFYEDMFFEGEKCDPDAEIVLYSLNHAALKKHILDFQKIHSAGRLKWRFNKQLPTGKNLDLIQNCCALSWNLLLAAGVRNLCNSNDPNDNGGPRSASIRKRYNFDRSYGLDRVGADYIVSPAYILDLVARAKEVELQRHPETVAFDGAVDLKEITTNMWLEIAREKETPQEWTHEIEGRYRLRFANHRRGNKTFGRTTMPTRKCILEVTDKASEMHKVFDLGAKIFPNDTVAEFCTYQKLAWHDYFVISGMAICANQSGPNEYKYYLALLDIGSIDQITILYSNNTLTEEKVRDLRFFKVEDQYRASFCFMQSNGNYQVEIHDLETKVIVNQETIAPTDFDATIFDPPTDTGHLDFNRQLSEGDGGPLEEIVPLEKRYQAFFQHVRLDYAQGPVGDAVVLQQDESDGFIVAIAALPGNKLVTTSQHTKGARRLTSTLKFWDMATGELITEEPAHTQQTKSLYVLSDKHLLVYGTNNNGTYRAPAYSNTIQIWAMESMSMLSEFDMSSINWPDRIKGGVFSVSGIAKIDENRIMIGVGGCCLNLNLELQKVESSNFLTRRGRADWRSIVCLSEHYFACGAADEIAIWEKKGKNLCYVRSLTGHSGHVRHLALLPDGRLVSAADPATNSRLDPVIRIWDLDKLTCSLKLEGHTGIIDNLVVANNIIISCARDETMRFWDPNTGQCIYRMEMPCPMKLHTLCVLADGRVSGVLMVRTTDPNFNGRQIFVWNFPPLQLQNQPPERNADAPPLSVFGAGSSALFAATEPSLTPASQERQNRLVILCEKGMLEEVRVLIQEHGASLRLADQRGLYPLGAAARSLNPNLVDYLESCLSPDLAYWGKCLDANAAVYGQVIPAKINVNACTFETLLTFCKDASLGKQVLFSKWMNANSQSAEHIISVTMKTQNGRRCAWLSVQAKTNAQGVEGKIKEFAARPADWRLSSVKIVAQQCGEYNNYVDEMLSRLQNHGLEISAAEATTASTRVQSTGLGAVLGGKYGGTYH